MRGRPILIDAMQGLGDSLYQRPVVRWYAERREVYLATAWPELFRDIHGVRFVRPGTDLRTQAKNVDRQGDGLWTTAPEGVDRMRVRYTMSTPGESIAEELVRTCAVPPAVRMDMPDFGPSPVRFSRYAVVRPVTHRKEWLNTARSPDPRYVARAAELLRRAGYSVVTVADVEPVRNQEWIEGGEPVADQRFHSGELDVTQLMALIRHASVVVGGVGFIVPAALAAGVPAVFIAGGQGAYNAPEVVCGPLVDDARVRWVMPDDYCRCKRPLHPCPKEITDFDAKFGAALAGAIQPRMAAA